jgi:hypothetical protein
MPLTTLDPMPALIVIDLQKSITGHPLVHPLPERIPLHAALKVNLLRKRVFIATEGPALIRRFSSKAYPVRTLPAPRVQHES